MTKFKTKKATSLIEVIVVLAIISLTIVSSISLVARTRIQIKNNEILDQTNGQAIKALEILKSPSSILVSNDANLTGIDVPYYFSLSNPSTGKYILQYQPGAVVFPAVTTGADVGTVAATGQPLPECTDGSVFYITGILNFNFCQQIKITPRNNIKTNSVYYEIAVTIVYKNYQNRTSYQTLFTYRYDNFKKTT